MIKCFSSPASSLNHWGDWPQCLQIAYIILVNLPAGVYLKNPWHLLFRCLWEVLTIAAAGTSYPLQISFDSFHPSATKPAGNHAQSCQAYELQVCTLARVVCRYKCTMQLHTLLKVVQCCLVLLTSTKRFQNMLQGSGFSQGLPRTFSL